MTRIIEARSTGKTKRLMELAKAENAIFVCGNAELMCQKAYEYGITGVTFMEYAEFLSPYRHTPADMKYVVDELENFMANIGSYHSQLIGYTISED